MLNDKGGGSHLTDTSKEDLRGVTTPPRGTGSEQCNVPNKTASDLILESQLQQMRTDEQGTREHEVFRQLAEELLIGQTKELLNNEELQNEATRAEEDRARAEADRVATLARAEADREKIFAREEADRRLARKRLLLRHKQEMLKLQQQHLHGNEMNMSAIPETGGVQPMHRYRHEDVDYPFVMVPSVRARVTANQADDPLDLLKSSHRHFALKYGSLLSLAVSNSASKNSRGKRCDSLHCKFPTSSFNGGESWRPPLFVAVEIQPDMSVSL